MARRATRTDDPSLLAEAEALLERAPREAIEALEGIAREGAADTRAHALSLLAMRDTASGSEVDFARSARRITTAARLARSPAARGRVAHARGHLAHHRGERAVVIDELNRAALLYARHPALRAQVFDTLGMHFGRHGDLARARAYFLRSVALKEKLPKQAARYGLALTYGNLGRLELSREEYEEAERWLRKDLELVLEGPPNETIEALVRGELATAMLGQGRARLDEARAELLRARDRAPEASPVRAMVLRDLARAALLDGDASLAEKHAHDARRLAEASEHTELTLSIRAVEGDVFAARAEAIGDRAASRAFAAYDDAQSGFERLGMPREHCQVLLARASLLSRLGRNDEALATLSQVALPIAERHLFAQLQPLARIEAAIEALNGESLMRARVRRMLGGMPADRHGARLRGVRHRVTVWTCDIRGFTRFCAETGDPRAVVEMLNRFFAVIGQRILDGGGRIDKYVGDNILAYFREPTSAAGVALAAIDAVDRLNAEREHLEERPLYIGVGLATGEIVEGNVGFAGKLEHTIIGSAVNTACRLVSEAEPGEVLIDDATREALGRAFVTRRAGRGSMELKGLGRVKVHRLVRRAGVARVSTNTRRR